MFDFVKQNKYNMKTNVIQLSSNEINKERNWKQFSHDPKRYDYIIDKILPFMVSEPLSYIEKFKSTFGEENEIVLDYNIYSTEDKEYFKLRLKEKYEQYLYCFFPNKYDEYQRKITVKNLQEEKQNHSSKYNNFQSNIFIF